MLGRAHTVFGTAVVSLVSQEPAALTLAAFFSIMPDMDKPFGHRAWFSHSLFSALVLSTVGLLASKLNLMYAAIIFIAITMHLLLDLMTKSGLPLLYPWKDGNYGFRLSASKDALMNKAFIVSGLAILAYTVGKPVAYAYMRL